MANVNTKTEEATPLQRARMRAAAQAIADGSLRVPLRCGRCMSQSVEESTVPGAARTLTCVQCGRETDLRIAKRLRIQEMTAVIRRGIDIPLQGMFGKRGAS